MFGRGKRGCVLLAFAAFCFAPASWAQQSELSGFVSDSTGAALVHATVSVKNAATNAQQQTVTNDSGIYEFPVLPAGVYQLTVSAAGFERKVIDGIQLAVAGKVSKPVSLAVSAVNETVTVSGDGVNINTVDAAVSTVVDRQFVENIPLNGRSFQSLLALVPGATIVPSQGVGVSGEMSVNGQRPEANYYTVDGVSANTGASTVSTGNGGGFSGNTPGQTALGTTQGMVSLDALEEFRASTSTYSAEYGRTPGGQFAFLTRGGTNQFHGSAYDYFRNDALDASNWFNNAAGVRKSAERQNDFGGTLGGPVWIPKLYQGRDRTFFFFSYEGLRLRAPQAATVTNVPSVAIRQSANATVRPFLNAFPVPNGADLGNGLAVYTSGYTNPSNMDAFSVRMDHSFTDTFKIFGRYAHTPSDAVSRASANLALANRNIVTANTATVGMTNIFGPRLSSETRFNVTRNDSRYQTNLDSFGGAVPFDLGTVSGLGSGSPNWFLFSMQYGLVAQTWIRPLTNRQRQTNVTETMTSSLGRHSLKWGMDYRRLQNSEYLPPLIQYGFFYTPGAVLAGNSTSTTLLKFTGAAKPVYQNFSAFLQDEFKASQRLSLSLGLRWDLNPAPKDGANNDPYTISSGNLATATLAPRGTALWKTTYANFAPRFGVAYVANRTPGHETVVRGGFGLFYDSGNAQGSQGYNGIGFYGQTLITNSAFPLNQQTIDNGATATIKTPYTSLVAAFDPNLKLPRVYEWNVALEQAIGAQQTLTASYVGAAGRRLLVQRYLNPAQLGNANFATGIYWTTNQAYSDYHALQLQFQRKLSHGLQALASYTFGHSTDNSSSNFVVYQFLHASSNFDVRHNFQTALTYDLPGRYANRAAAALLKGWAIDSRINIRSAFPLDVTGAYDIDPASGNYLYYQPNVSATQPLYKDDPSAPGGRVINYAAFSVPRDASNRPVQGNAGRNLARGFGAWQADFTVRRNFRLTERLGWQLRVETFNIFNHPMFGSVYSNMVNNGPAIFGRAFNTQNSQLGGLNSLFQQGGPRSMQLAVRFSF